MPQERFGPPARARIRKQLKKGDRPRIAEITGLSISYVNKVLDEIRASKSAKANTVWLVARQLITQRDALKKEFQVQ